MANIDLTNIFKKKVDTVSPVDSEIIIDKSQSKEEIYSDIKMDLDYGNRKSNYFNADVSKNDLEKITNEAAVLTSLRNMMNTTYASRLLNPELDFDMRSYLFENLTEAKAYFIGYDLYHSIPAFEPRVAINKIAVDANIKEDTYSITLSITIPSLKKDITVNSILSEDGFLFG